MDHTGGLGRGRGRLAGGRGDKGSLWEVGESGDHTFVLSERDQRS